MTQKLAKVAATVQGITESHTILYGRLLVAFEAYAKRQLPPREERISRILDCEGNGAHVLIENFATAIKAVPRGDLESYPICSWQNAPIFSTILKTISIQANVRKQFGILGN